MLPKKTVLRTNRQYVSKCISVQIFISINDLFQKWSVSLERIAASVVEKCPTSVQSVRTLEELRDLGANMGSAPYPPPMQDGYPEDIQTSIIDQWGSERSYYYPDSGCPGTPCDSWWQVNLESDFIQMSPPAWGIWGIWKIEILG